MTLKILFIGDMVGKISRKAASKILPELKIEYEPDLVIANVENAAHGSGITDTIYQELKSCGIDVMTLGDHAFDKKEVLALLSKNSNNIIRPENFPPHLAGKGSTLIEVGSKKVLIINLLGRVFMKMNYDCPFRGVDEILKKYEKENISAIIVDFHAEASSEKKALGWYLDGRVSALLGTHTHVPTCDHDILPQGSGYITDIGMAGAKNSVIGINKDAAIRGFLDQTKTSLEPVEEGICIFNSVMLEIDPVTKKCQKIIRIDKEITV